MLATLQDWVEASTLREISAVVEGTAVGYESALAAAKVSPERLEAAVAVINAHPTVTHNYERDHDYNLWFTLSVPHAMGLESTARLLAAEAGLDDLHLARRIATYKIGVNIDLVTKQNRTDVVAIPEEAVRPVALSTGEQATLRALQQPLPVTSRPFDLLAEIQGVGSEAMLAFGKHHLGGMIRRYSGVMRHRKLGVRSNGMVVWNVPTERLDEVGRALAGVPEVSHCYARDSFPDFPYSLYTMVHAPDPEVLQEITGRMGALVEVGDYRVLVSTREFKKTRLRYFLHELEDWWHTHRGEEGTG